MRIKKFLDASLIECEELKLLKFFSSFFNSVCIVNSLQSGPCELAKEDQERRVQFTGEYGRKDFWG